VTSIERLIGVVEFRSRMRVILDDAGELANLPVPMSLHLDVVVEATSPKACTSPSRVKGSGQSESGK